MPRTLTDYEWSAFLHDVDLSAIPFPPWGGVVDWNGADILVFIGPPHYIEIYDITKDKGREVSEVFLTDITDLGDAWKAQARMNYASESDVFWAELPNALADELARRAGQAAVVLQKVGGVIGKTAGDLTGPLLGNLTVPLIAVGLVALVWLYKK